MDHITFTFYPDPASYVLYLGLFVLIIISIAGSIGIMGYLFFSHLRVVGPDKEKIKKSHKQAGIFAGFILFLIFSGIVYTLFWNTFYEISLNKDQVHLTYLFPKRVHTYPLNSVYDITYSDLTHRNHLVVTLTNGEKFYSSNLDTDELHRITADLNSFINSLESD